MVKEIERLKNSLLALFLKSNCPLCDRPAEAELCEYCQRQLQRCQMSNPSEFWQEELPVFVWGNYGGVLKRAIAALKYDNKPQLARPLGYWLGEAWLKSPAVKGSKKLTVVPIPIHPSKRQKRGFNQAELIAQSFCQFTGYSHQPLGLERIRETEAQFGLSVQERSQNLADAFEISKSLRRNSPNSPVLIVDDIYTTGATVRSAAQILHNYGIKVYGVVAIASSKKGMKKVPS
ncbi:MULTISPECIES: ComF family protein [unclassified Coleofasciculus]|uniref:ComF family protein n=1 Tax=unclassified Coleofasciculus TaxID=2692782 RepID=UPI00187F860F|nr:MULTISPECIES: ComF family protein [unclassified Coleofasciculus]MBE9127876.1 ComF family protein [Coleofasciculus sp. LEGE 07081]MBE9151068.1 ComF family protein [Coleofasciculus sp. LEGE 07092]